ncbi:hypothetical protein DERF_004861 [Dermatophagoides farinae]|uniref:Uncharacterized protein n=1 Tax=Dermatophagoides farinae TaxID=6954 RepID=A0A922I4R8_DERFA|nr:hypothetical protein DERF_004861 [Dermatophagoides farinae]
MEAKDDVSIKIYEWSIYLSYRSIFVLAAAAAADVARFSATSREFLVTKNRKNMKKFLIFICADDDDNGG